LYYWEQTTRGRSGQFIAQEFRTGLYDIAHVLASDFCTAPVPPGFQSCSALIYGPAGRPPNGALTVLDAGSFDRLFSNTQDGYAVFGEGKITLPAAFELTLGLRYHEEDVRSQMLTAIPGITAPKPTRTNEWYTGGDPLAGAPAGIPTAFTYDKVTSRLSLDKRFNDSVMGYALYSEGFNSGGIATPIVDGVRLEIPYEPETMKNFELGLRSEWAAGRVRLNATLFRVIWDDLQARTLVVVNGRVAPALHVQNIGEAEAKGLELELSWLPTERLQIDLAVGSLDTAFTELPPGQTSGHLPWTTDTEFAQAPEESYTLGLQYDAPLRSGALITTRLDYLYQGQFWRSEPFLRMDAYPSVPLGYDESGDSGILNLRVVYSPPARNWRVAMFGTNLTNEYTLNSGFFAGVWGFDFATVGRPREAGVSLSVRF
jgi:iron complex outermembrane receptor protein